MKVFGKKLFFFLFLFVVMSLLFIFVVFRLDREYCIGDMGFFISLFGCSLKFKFLISFGVFVGEFCGLFRL